jgi:pimeloyl-ACP methyl ester carboxylesterase
MTHTPSIYTSLRAQTACMSVYERALAAWPVPHEELDVPTRLGITRVIASGRDDAPPLVLLHGQWATATMWSSIIEQLSAGSRVYAVDQVDDVGKSVPSRMPSSRADYADWLLDVFDGLVVCEADVAGLSHGGFLATNLAMKSPGRVRRLVLLCPGVPSFGPPTVRWAIHGMPITLMPTHLNGKWLVKGMTVRGYRADDLEAEQLITSAVSVRKRTPTRPSFDAGEFASLTMPVLFLVGDHEAMYDAQRAMERVRELIPHAETTIVPDAGHMLTSDQPEVVAGHIVRFLHRGDSL